MYNQKTTFVNYCKKHPIDMTILKCSWLNLNQLWQHIGMLYDENKIYIKLLSNEHTYIFKFKDDQAIHKFFNLLYLTPEPDLSCDYTETSIRLNHHNLNYVMLNESTGAKAFYTFDSDTNHILIKVYVDGTIMLHDDLYKIIHAKQNLSDTSWNYIKRESIPWRIRKLVTIQQVIITLL